MPGTGRISVTYSLSPYILPHFGSVADGSLRYTYSSVHYDEVVPLMQRCIDVDAGIVEWPVLGPTFLVGRVPP